MTITREVSSEDWSWFAGFFDGEGCVTFSRCGDRNPNVRLVISQIDDIPLRWIQYTFGVGKISKRNDRGSYTFYVSRRLEVFWVLENLLPRLKLPKRQVQVERGLTILYRWQRWKNQTKHERYKEYVRAKGARARQRKKEAE